MDSVKIERVSPLLQEPSFSDGGSHHPQVSDDYKPDVKEYMCSSSSDTCDQSASQGNSLTLQINQQSVSPRPVNNITSKPNNSTNNCNNNNNNNLNNSNNNNNGTVPQNQHVQAPHQSYPHYAVQTAGVQPQNGQTLCRNSLDSEVVSVITSQNLLDGSGSAVLLHSLENRQCAEGETQINGNISDAVTKILEDYDWSQIPLANK